MKKDVGHLHVITDESIQNRFTHVEIAEAAIAGGTDTIQFRDKSLSTRKLIETAEALRAVCASSGVPLIINDRADIALAVDADGVHLGRGDLPVATARNLLGPDKIVGGTAGTLEEAIEAERAGADYVGFGHIYPTSSKDKSHVIFIIMLLLLLCCLAVWLWEYFLPTDNETNVFWRYNTVH